MIVYVSIGNSDDKLSQKDWSDFSHQVHYSIVHRATQVHGFWHSIPTAPFQNVCFCFEITGILDIDKLKHALSELGRAYKQDAIAWAVAETEFL